MTAIHCPFCPFAGCIWCEHKGGETTETQGNPGAHEPSRTPEFDTIGAVSETAPTEARQRFNRGLTTGSTPD